MDSSRFGGVNILLLVIAVLAVLFGAWGFLFNNNAPAPQNLAEYNDGEASDTRTDGQDDAPEQPGKSRTSQPPRRTAAAPETGAAVNLAPAGMKIELGTLQSNPTDSGTAQIEGRVIDAQGAGLPGISVTAIRSNLNLGAAPTDTSDIAKFQEDVVKFISQSARERRVTTTAADGKFRFEGLDGKLSYNLIASTEGGGSGRQDRVAAGDNPIIILSPDSQLRGRVEDAEGKPITTFTIRAWQQGWGWQTRTEHFQSEDGTFSMNGKVGNWLCEVTAAGYAKSDETEASIGPGSAEIVFKLGKAAIVSGVVTDESGAPLAGAKVYLGARRIENRGYWDGGNRTITVTTDTQGRFRFDSLSPKDQTITASFGASEDTQKIDAKEGENTLDFKLSAGARVVLRLTGATGQSVEADQIWFQGKNQQWEQATRMPSKEPGLIEYAGIKAGEYTMNITAAGWPTLRKPVTIKEGVNELAFQFSEGATLVGTVTGAGGTAVEGIGVRLRKDEDDGGGWNPGRSAAVRTGGRYKLGPAEPGQWKLEVYVTNNWKVVHSTPVTLVAGENTQDLVVESAGSVTITVTDESGASVPWAEVQLRGEQTHNGRSDQGGKATISFVAPGTYQVYASSQNLVSKNYPLIVNNGDNVLTIVLAKTNACRITHIYPDTQAAKQGLQAGDIVIEYNTEQISSWRALGQAIRKTKPADNVIVLVERNGQTLTFQVKGGTLGVEGADAAR